MPVYEYDIAISFAGEDRSHAEALALACISRKIRVFYDKFEAHNLWGKDLIEYLYEVYGKQARYCIILVSKYYVAAGKGWPRHERKSAQEREFREEGEYILPIRLDDTPVPGLPETVGYIRYSDYTMDSLTDLVIRKLGYPLRDGMPVDAESQAPSPKEAILSEVVFDPKQDQRFIRHENITEKLLPVKDQYGYYSLHSFIVPMSYVSDERLKNTFLDMNRAYSDTLHYAQSPDVHPDGYTRRYEIRRDSNERVTTQATTCYFNGHIVTEGYIDVFCEGKDGFNPNWFIYMVQRHLQLTKEVFDSYTTMFYFVMMFQEIERFKWEIYRHAKIWQEKHYVGYHDDIILPVQLTDIHGRDKWNIKMQIAEDIVTSIARMFGMDRLPQPYWNENEELDYPLGMSSR